MTFEAQVQRCGKSAWCVYGKGAGGTSALGFPKEMMLSEHLGSVPLHSLKPGAPNLLLP